MSTTVTYTTLDITLTDAMQDWLSQDSGIYAFAILYGAASSADTVGYQSSATMVDDGVIQSADGTFSLALTSASMPQLWSGKVYFIIQSTDDPSLVIDPVNYDQADINWGNAATLDFRYDSVEVSLTGVGGDAANLTSIEGFGIPMTLSASTGSRGYLVSGDTIFDDVAAAPTDNISGLPPVTTFTDGGLAGEDRLGVSPAVSVAPGGGYTVYQAADWNDYIDALQDPATSILVNGFFNGAPDAWAGGKVWRNAGFYSYELSWDEQDGTFWLTPTEGSQIQGAIRITADELASSIYSTIGQVQLFDSPDDTSPVAIYPDGTTWMNSGANNGWGTVLQQLTLGLTAGYLQSTGASPNPAVTAPIDLNQNYNWSPTYAFGTNTTSLLPSDVAQRFDPYAEIFFRNSNSYGSQYTDALMNAFQQGGPQLPTWVSGANVPTLSVTLFADTETPPAGSYTPPELFDYVAGSEPGGQYAIPQFWQGNASNIVLNFNPGISLAQGLVLEDDVEISFRVMTGYSGTTPQWQSFSLGGGAAGPWQTWTFNETNGALTLTGNGVVGTPESLTLVGLPMAESGVAWYQIVVEQGDFEKAFNLYTTTFLPAGQSLPQFSNFGADGALFGIDGLATLTPGAMQGSGGGLLNFSVNITGPTPTIDLALMQPNTSSSYLNNQAIMAAPVAGTLSGADFLAIGGQTEAPMAGGNGVGLDVTAASGTLAFGWTGLNGAATETASWIQSFTNLVQGDSVAVVDILTAGGGASIAPLQAVADITGAWQTQAAQLGNGTYTVSMTAYAADASSPGTADRDTPLTRQSATLTVTVDLDDLALAPAADGRGIGFEPVQGGPLGNWIRFTTSAGGLPDGVAVLLYAVDDLGRPVGPDGLPVTSLEAAALGWVGTVGSDSGALLLHGFQSVYLPAELQLRFALADDDGSITPTTPDAITEQPDGTLSIALDGLTLAAEVDNTLLPDEQAAAVQRMYGTPVVWLEEGDRVEVTVTGSARNINTLGFVRVSVDPLTGEVGIPGAGSGAAFDNAVRDRLDDGYRATLGGGTFTNTGTWTLEGETGFYAPVLLTERGLVFVGGIDHADGIDYVRTFGANIFGFEDLTAAQGSDFDYNDMVMRLRPMLDDL